VIATATTCRTLIGAAEMVARGSVVVVSMR
jgi:hypothetical protein